MAVTFDQARTILARETFTSSEAFDALAAIGRHGAFGDRDEAQDLVIRALDRRSQFSGSSHDLLQRLVREFGLFPYLRDVVELPFADRLAFEAHKPSPWASRENLVFHSEQAMVYERLLAGENVVLSAPTSFGKSLIIDAVLAVKNFNNVAIIVPTIALMDEARRRLAHLGDRYKIITHGSQGPAERNLWIMTQERMLETGIPDNLDFFVVDEFYKLDPSHGDDRSSQLNILVWQLLRTPAQFYMLGPNITALSDSTHDRLRATLITTGYSTVATDIERIRSTKDSLPDDLAAVCDDVGGGTLIFCSSPQRTRIVASWLLERGIGGGRDLEIVADWIGETYHPAWIVGKAVRQGIGIHHGRLPRALVHHMVRLFNDARIPFLIVTSTLIEGVNTAAKNVVILDNKIAARKYDYFTFSNIRGRSGRMFRHYVGRVVVFNPEPRSADLAVDIPVLSQSPAATPEVLIQLPEEKLSDESKARLRPYLEQQVVSLETLRRNRGVALDRQLRAAEIFNKRKGWWSQVLRWGSPFPTAQQVRGIADVLFELTGPGTAVRTPAQLSARINILRRHRANIRALVDNQLENFDADPDMAVEDTLDFIRNWAQFKIPTALTTLGNLAKDVLGPVGRSITDPGVFAGQLENLFLQPFASVLEEYGIPMSLTSKIESQLGLAQATSLDDVLGRLREMRVPGLLTPFEREMFQDARIGL